MDDEPPAHLIDWRGNDWTPASSEKAAHPNSRYCVPIEQCPTAAPEFDDWQGVKLDAILFGGRRPDTVPLVTQALSWEHGTLIGAMLASGQTAASAEAKVGSLRHDPMAMLPFIGYNVGDYFQNWLDMGERGGDRLPSIFLVNWFRRGDDGRFLWPGFGENSRVLKWVIERIEGKAAAVETPIGHVPTPESLDVDGLGLTDAQLEKALAVDVEEWKAEIPQIEEWFAKFGDQLPVQLQVELDGLKERLGA